MSELQKYGWKKLPPVNVSDPGSPEVLRETFDLEGHKIGEEVVNQDDEIQARVKGTRIYDIVDAMMATGDTTPLETMPENYGDVSELPETDMDAINLQKTVQAAAARIEKETQAKAQEEKEADIKALREQIAELTAKLGEQKQ